MDYHYWLSIGMKFQDLFVQVEGRDLSVDTIDITEVINAADATRSLAEAGKVVRSRSHLVRAL